MSRTVTLAPAVQASLVAPRDFTASAVAGRANSEIEFITDAASGESRITLVIRVYQGQTVKRAAAKSRRLWAGIGADRLLRSEYVAQAASDQADLTWAMVTFIGPAKAVFSLLVGYMADDRYAQNEAARTLFAKTRRTPGVSHASIVARATQIAQITASVEQELS